MKSILHIKNERILFSPLNWGMGHVARSIPLLQALMNNQNVITVACSADQRKVYQEYFEGVDYILWDGYPFRFGGKGNFAWDLFRSFSKLKRFGKQELKRVDDLLNKDDFTMILSDNRYYFRSKKVKSIFISHQVSLPLPWYLKTAQSIHYALINRFDELWIVDDEKLRLAGELSEKVYKIKIPSKYIGLLSRFSLEGNNDSIKGTTILVSGPEPYAKQFYLKMKEKLLNSDTVIIYNGKAEALSGLKSAAWKDIDEYLLNSKRVISRSGYSTLMDTHFLNCETEWYPTPGQWEQEYLAEIQG